MESACELTGGYSSGVVALAQTATGLYLFVQPTGTRSSIQRLVVRGRRREFGLGAIALVPLAEARKQALANRKPARVGGDPWPSASAQRACPPSPTPPGAWSSRSRRLARPPPGAELAANSTRSRASATGRGRRRSDGDGDARQPGPGGRDAGDADDGRHGDARRRPTRCLRPRSPSPQTRPLEPPRSPSPTTRRTTTRPSCWMPRARIPR